MAKFVNPNLEKIKSNILLFEQFHHRNADFFDFIKPNSGSTAFIKLTAKEPALQFAERLVKDTGIMLLPSETFEYGESHARIGFGRENMPQILEKFEVYINNNGKHYRTV
jgi:aspartate/methionine/tyrosine aminotransferase